MKLFSKEEMQNLEAAGARFGVSLEQMMENAGAALAREAQERWGPLSGKGVVLLCGRGNNGGDGFVCARILFEEGARCAIVLVQGLPKTSLAQQAFSRLPPTVQVIDCVKNSSLAGPALSPCALVIDCLFGFGFHGSLDPHCARVLALANALGCPRLAADLPSGTECDTGRADPGSFRAQVTVAFTGEKPAHQSYPAKEFAGETVVRQVGLPPALVDSAQTGASLTTLEQVRALLPRPDVQTNKGSMGRLLLVCGSYGMAGACIMAARAALRSGVGLVDIAADARIYSLLAPAVPEAVFTVLDLEDPQAAASRLESALQAATACAAGCGLGALADLLCPILFSQCRVPLLLDADALNHCARSGFPLKSLGVPLLITPHPGEAARLTGHSVSEIQRDRIGTARLLAEISGGTALLKGAGTVIASPEGRLALNSTGNPGMAKGGSGDVLTGITGALMAQGLSPFSAAQAGAFLHGLCGDLCRDALSARSMLPTDVIEYLPEICKKVERG
ncbi:NAD(P)H-hydrate dehydratase [Acutalibacter sp. 1XD8-33]|uniref:NAD(P)H-hydrate dehydratase n=1 Tax=Acutalibacter sp. 1XD8-33 TaxID=2320081 RepID=UPI000EA00CCE|nr:NAD(P)H-hydrate dehydratase [Acutalibacter sp. 1XD8-33]RKJ42118.1 NAD(P)H-hydrate dehydratase [Acutalibacter sp. 1XD8-33]